MSNSITFFGKVYSVQTLPFWYGSWFPDIKKTVILFSFNLSNSLITKVTRDFGGSGILKKSPATRRAVTFSFRHKSIILEKVFWQSIRRNLDLSPKDLKVVPKCRSDV